MIYSTHTEGSTTISGVGGGVAGVRTMRVGVGVDVGGTSVAVGVEVGGSSVGVAVSVGVFSGVSEGVAVGGSSVGVFV